MAGATVSIIVPTCNAGVMLQECLNALQGDIDCEIVVVDNGSVDGSTGCVCDYPQVTLVRCETNLGFAMACNLGATHSAGEYLLFLNDDVKVNTDTVSGLSRHLDQHPGVAAVQPTLIEGPAGSVFSYGSVMTRTGFLHHLSSKDLQAFGQTRFALKGACFMIRRSVFDSLNGFDDEFFAYFEESDLCWRALLRGWDLEHIGSIQADHVGGATTRRLFTSEYIDFLSFRNRVVANVSNWGAFTLLYVLPLHYLVCFGIAVMLLLTGRARNSWAIARAMLYPVWHCRQVWQRRRRVQRSRCVSDDVLLRRLGTQMQWQTAIASIRGYVVRW